MTCYVYFAKFTDGTIKIGLSQHLGARLASLQREMGLRGSFVGRLELHNRREAQIVERALHRRLGAAWIRGEFYADTQEVRSEIRRLLKDAAAVDAIVASVREAERLARLQAAKPRPRVQVIARLAREVVRATPEAPHEELMRAVEALCERHHVQCDGPSVVNALRIASSLERREGHVTAAKKVVLVLQELVVREPFTSYGDLAEALKQRCARLKVPYDSSLVSSAIEQLERGSNHPLVTPPPALVLAEVAPPRELTRREAAELWGNIVDYFGPRAFKALPGRGVSRVRLDDTRTDDVVDVESLVGGVR